MTSATAAADPVPGVPQPAPRVTKVMVTGTDSSLGVRVVALLSHRPEFEIVPAASLAS